MPKTGLLLINLGTPDAPDTASVRRYLREFLSDPRVLDVNPAMRSVVLNLFILPRRPAQSAAAYQTIWTDRGSPLLFHTADLTEKVRQRVGESVHVEFAMRYQHPSISDALERFRERSVDRIVAFPLFPQYASSATGSALAKVFEEAGKLWNVPAIQVVPPFFDHPAFIRAFTAVAQPVLDDFAPDYVLLSYHGLPERHVVKSDESGGRHCLRQGNCCDEIVDANRNCYRAQCFATSRALTTSLGLAPKSWEITFQSRLGRDPWIRPYTDVRLTELAASGVKRLAVLCPAFVADCLETLEEIGIRALEDFKAHGGEDLKLVPSLNATDDWVSAVIDIASAEIRHPAEA